MRRPIPDRAMPDRAVIEPCVGFAKNKPLYGDPFTVRANFNVGRRNTGSQTTLDAAPGFSISKSGDVLLDDLDDLPMLSAVTNEATGTSVLVGSVQRFDQPPMQPFLFVGLGQLA